MKLKKFIVAGLTLQVIVGAFQVTALLKTQDSKQQQLASNQVETNKKHAPISEKNTSAHHNLENQELDRLKQEAANIEENTNLKKVGYFPEKNDSAPQQDNTETTEQGLASALSEEESSEIEALFEQVHTNQISPSIFAEEFELLKLSLPIKKHGLLMMKYSKAINSQLIESSYFIH